jgi:mRNA interferase RelE/StbE
VYRVLIEKRCLRDLKRLDRAVAAKALELIERVVTSDPHAGKALTGPYKGLWSYRFSDYRVIYEIRECELVVVVLRVRHRREVYDGL